MCQSKGTDIAETTASVCVCGIGSSPFTTFHESVRRLAAVREHCLLHKLCRITAAECGQCMPGEKQRNGTCVHTRYTVFCSANSTLAADQSAP